MIQRVFKSFIQPLSTIVLLYVSAGAGALAPGAEWFKPQSQDKQSQLIEQRYHYELAKSAIGNNNIETFQKHYALLGDYPLAPYLDYSLIKNTIYDFDFPSIDRFLETNRDTFLEFRLREQLLSALATKHLWREYLDYYSDAMNKKSLLCHWFQARIALGDTAAYSEVAAIWSEGKSQPKQCDPLFKQWRHHGGLTDEIAWTRFNNAMKNNKQSLAQYVSRFMSEDVQNYAKAYLGVHAYPGRIKQHRRFAEASLKTQQIISHGIKRLARTDPKQALYHWERYEAQQLFPKEVTVDTKIYLVKRLASKGFTQEAESLIEHSGELRQKDVVERLIREALRNEQYTKVIAWISYLNQESRASDRWQYWLARAQDEVGGAPENVSSTEIYQALSKHRSFYGFLSADILNRAYSLDHKPSVVTESTALVVENMPAIKRARELWLKGNYSEAAAEWHFTTQRMSDNELAAAGKIARKWGWYNKGIHAMIRGNYWDDLDIRFPLAYRETVEKVSTKTAIEERLIYAIARQESAFSEKARSSAGAMGLMQLMPGTARQTARKSGITHHDSYLYDPEYNINLGSQYLNELLGQFNGNRILAAAAYNAGPHRVTKWIKRAPLELPFDVWIETIPFKETRGYVQNVLAFSVIYAYRLGQDAELVTESEINHSL